MTKKKKKTRKYWLNNKFETFQTILPIINYYINYDSLTSIKELGTEDNIGIFRLLLRLLVQNRRAQIE